MTIRRFLKEFFSSRGRTSGHAEAVDETVGKIRETMGPQAAGGAGGRLTGHAVYDMFERDLDTSDTPPDDVTK